MLLGIGQVAAFSMEPPPWEMHRRVSQGCPLASQDQGEFFGTQEKLVLGHAMVLSFQLVPVANWEAAKNATKSDRRDSLVAL